MASTGINNGTLVGLYSGGVLISKLTSNDFSLDQALRDATTKDSGGWQDNLTGLRSASFSAEGLFAEDSTLNFEDFFDLVNTRASSVIRLSSEVTGDIAYEATAFITNASLGAPLEDNQTFTLSFTTSGAVTKVTVT